jgi:hypothetical protein
MLDRSTQNLFQAAPPTDCPLDPPPVLESEGEPSGSPSPRPMRAARSRQAFISPRLYAPAARAKAAWRKARHFLPPLLVIVTVARLAAGGCGSPSTPSSLALVKPGVHIKPPATRASATSRVSTPRPRGAVASAQQRRRYRQSVRAVTSVAPQPNTLPTSPAAVIPKAAPPSGEATAVQPSAMTRDAGQEFGFEH